MSGRTNHRTNGVVQTLSCLNLILEELRRTEGPPSGAPYPYRKVKNTHELIFSWLSWLAVLLVGRRPLSGASIPIVPLGKPCPVSFYFESFDICSSSLISGENDLVFADVRITAQMKNVGQRRAWDKLLHVNLSRSSCLLEKRKEATTTKGKEK